MNGEEFEKSIHALHEKLLQLTATKGAEYTQGRDNRFDNFERQAEALGLTREQVLLVFLNKHLDSITTYVKDRALNRGRVYSEPMTGRVDDAILYLLLLRGMMEKNEAAYFGAAFAAMDERSELRWQGESSFNAVAEAIGKLPVVNPADYVNGVFIPHAQSQKVTLDVGGVTTAARTVEVELRPAGRQVIISVHHPAAVKLCQSMGLTPGTSALSAPDQLFGFGRGDLVIFINVGSATCASMLGELRQRAKDQGFQLAERML